MASSSPPSGPPLEPLDSHNLRLLENVHPDDWMNPRPADRYHLVVVGAGTAGLVAAAGAAGVGATVALVERNLMGGDCLNVGCIPSKALLRSAQAVGEVREAARLGVRFGPGDVRDVDFAAVMERMRAIRARISPHDSAERFSRELGVDVFLGSGRFTGAQRLDVDGAELRFSRAVVATGARPAVPPIEGLRESGFLTNETVFNLTERPRRLLVLGGGPIGCELAQAFRRFGSEVVVVEMQSRLLGREDADAACVLADALGREGVDLRLATGLARVESVGEERRVTLEHDGKRDILEVDAILVAVGRAPNVEGMGLDAAGVETDRSGVVVNDHLRTSNPRIFAAGDVAMSAKFTHAADFAARAVVQNALFPGPKRKLSGLTIPWCTYTQPEIAHVGLSETSAAEKGVALDTYVREWRDVDRAIAEGEEDGFVKIHTRKGSDRIAGATVVARHAGELISEVSVAMAGGVGLGKLANVIHPYPTRSEAIRQIGDAYNRTRLTPGVKRLFKALLALRR